jgi:uncharacterized membrane protein
VLIDLGTLAVMDSTTRAWWVVVVIMAAACIAFIAHAAAIGGLFLLVALPAVAVADYFLFSGALAAECRVSPSCDAASLT